MRPISQPSKPYVTNSPFRFPILSQFPVQELDFLKNPISQNFRLVDYRNSKDSLKKLIN